MRLTPLLSWLIACGQPASPGAPDAWRAATTPRLAAADHEIVERSGHFVATFPAMGMRAEFSEQGLSVDGNSL
ncbi:MAG: hypothetical protein FJ102_12010, partial [Deltaproteobacteria bacterium]|nr:hypothetical protein [Deltaproteobacteria bacterium]